MTESSVVPINEEDEKVPCDEVVVSEVDLKEELKRAIVEAKQQ